MFQAKGIQSCCGAFSCEFVALEARRRLSVVMPQLTEEVQEADKQETRPAGMVINLHLVRSPCLL